MKQESKDLLAQAKLKYTEFTALIDKIDDESYDLSMTKDERQELKTLWYSAEDTEQSLDALIKEIS